MELLDRLDALRALMQVDVGRRGLAGEMFGYCAGDLAEACFGLATHTPPSVAIVTGFHIPGPDRPETDGPPGAVFLARVLTRLGAGVCLLSEPSCHAALRAGLEECGLQLPVGDFSQVPKRLRYVISIERVGPARDGRCYTMRGIDITEHVHDVEPLIVYSPAKTIGIGDGGNEIGMGKLPRSMIARNITRGEQIACRVRTNHVIIAGISNWGAWALGVGTALVRGIDPGIDIDLERRILSRMVADGGLIDGVTGEAALSVDGLPWGSYIEPLVAMRKVVG